MDRFSAYFQHQQVLSDMPGRDHKPNSAESAGATQPIECCARETRGTQVRFKDSTRAYVSFRDTPILL